MRKYKDKPRGLYKASAEDRRCRVCAYQLEGGKCSVRNITVKPGQLCADFLHDESGIVEKDPNEQR